MGRKATIKQSPDFDEPRIHSKSGQFTAARQSDHDDTAFDSILNTRTRTGRDEQEYDHDDGGIVNEGPIPPSKRLKSTTANSNPFLHSSTTTTKRVTKQPRTTRNTTTSTKNAIPSRWPETAGESSTSAQPLLRKSNSKPSPPLPQSTASRPSLFNAPPEDEEEQRTIFRRPAIPNVKSFLDSLPVPLSPLYPTFARLGCTSSKDMLALASPSPIGLRCRDAFLELLDAEFHKIAGTGLSSWHRIVLLEGLKAEWEIHGDS